MFSTWNHRIPWLLGIVVATVLGSAVLLREQDYTASREAIAETLAVQRAIGDTLSLLKDAETGQRGFLLTGNEAFLAPYERARTLLPAQLDDLRQRTRRDVADAQSVEEVARLSQAKLEELAHTIGLARRGELDTARDLVKGGRGRELMLGLRAQTQQMLDRQQTALAQRESAGASERRQFVAIFVGVLGFIAVVLAGGLWSAARAMAEAQRATQRLAEGQKALRSLADNASDLVRIIGDRAQLLYVSPSCQRILGYTQEEMLVMEPRALMHEDERERARELTERVRAGTAPNVPIVHRLRCKDGSYRWFETTYCLAQQDAARPSRDIQLTSRDITERWRAAQEMRHQSTRLESILASMGDGVVVLDQDRRLVIVNPTARAYIRQEPGQQVPKDWSKDHQTYLPDGKTLFPSEQGPLTRALRGEACDGTELLIHDRAGTARSFSVTSRPIVLEGVPAGCVAVYRDITEQRRAERALAESEQRLRVLSEASFEGMAISRGGIILDTSSLFASWFGRTPAELVGKPGLELFAPEDRELVREQSAQATTYQAHMLRPDGTRFPVEVRGRDVSFRGEPARIAVIRDITEQRRQEAELEAQARQLEALSLRDDLTGLYNRRGFQEHGQRQLRNAARTRRPACVFFIDLNGMKGINDTLGHEVGDRALVATAQLLGSVFRASDVVARLGGDEFAIFAQECSLDDVPAVRARIDERVDALNISGGERFHLSLSVGAAIHDVAHPAELDELLETADRSMYEEKRAHSSRMRADRAGDAAGEQQELKASARG